MKNDQMTPIEVGQWRKSAMGVWEVMQPGKRKGRWIVAASLFPFDLMEVGRKEIEGMKLMPDRKYFGGRKHPGAEYHRNLASAFRQMEEKKK